HALPRRTMPLAPAPKRMEPRACYLDAKASHSLAVRRDSVVREVSAHDGTDPFSLYGDWEMSSSHEFLANRPKLRAHPALRGVADEQELPRPRLPANVREAEEVEDLRLALPAFTTPLFGERPEAQVACLVGVQLETELFEASAQIGTKPARIALVLESQNEI